MHLSIVFVGNEKSLMSASSKKKSLIKYLLVLSLMFFLVELAVELSASGDAGFVLSMVNDHTMSIPSGLFLPLIFFALVQIALYTAFSLLAFACAFGVTWLFRLDEKNLTSLSFFIWLLMACSVLLANAIFYPASSFAFVLAALFSPMVTKILFAFCLLALSGVFLLAASAFLKVLWFQSRLIKSMIFLFALLLCLTAEMTKPVLAKPNLKEQSPFPNIIFIGVDSLRPDYTKINDPSNTNDVTPHLDQFLKNATIFTSATTPIARTFPSWTAILTGELPVHTNARFNLEEQTAIDLRDSLPDLLKAHGYTTFYATDEKRFSNISKRFGFDSLVGPTPGVNDFILGTINDLPLSNLVINIPVVGHWLFPYNAGNRASFHNYRPSTFNAIVEEALLKEPKSPLFIAVHFCLPHWPYSWSTRPYDEKLFPSGLYAEAAAEGDRQAGQFIDFLKKNHFMDNAIVVVLSDHGEGILLPNDRMVTKKTYIAGKHSDANIFKELDTVFGFKGYHFDASYGHGSDILSYKQFHTVLAVQTFGNVKRNLAKRVDAPVSEIDIKPTILSLLNLSSPKTDGISLTPFLYGQGSDLSKRATFSETGFNPIQLKANAVDIKSTIAEGIKVFRINPSFALVMKPLSVKEIVPTKQRIVLYQNWALALYPQHPPKVVAVLINRKTGQWTDDLNSPFAKTAPVALMKQKLASLYGREITPFYPYQKNH